MPCGAVPLSLLFYQHSFIHGFLVFTAMFTLAPVVITGWLTRSQQYATWSKPFIIKTVLSLILFVTITIRCMWIGITGAVSGTVLYKILALIISPALSIVVTIMGIVITQGRFGGRAIYRNEAEDMTISIKKSSSNPLQEDIYDRI